MLNMCYGIYFHIVLLQLPSKMWGDFSLQVSTVIEDQLETLLLMSEKENGLFIHESEYLYIYNNIIV